MVDVGSKEETDRRAVASGHIRMGPGTFQRLLDGDLPKGDVLGTARIAGITAAKRAWEIIPLCHPVRLTGIEMELLPDGDLPGVRVRASVRAKDRTGVEMEALTAVSIGLLTIYDMLKGIDREMEFGNIRLDRKSGGRRGDYVREGSGFPDRAREKGREKRKEEVNET